MRRHDSAKAKLEEEPAGNSAEADKQKEAMKAKGEEIKKKGIVEILGILI